MYKKPEAKLKRSYKQIEGNRLNILKKNNPRQFFFARFRKKPKSVGNVPIDKNVGHFKKITHVDGSSDTNCEQATDGCFL